MRLWEIAGWETEIPADGVMPYDTILMFLAAVFPVLGCGLFVIFWKMQREDRKPDPIYGRKEPGHS